ncbi:hypothetical protein SAMN05421780_101422 [Flexibacter flexilis DSM 6793]|uniref:SpoIIAA-like n=1 Tax=Flexibacter flexilis DSM 6793 TaxID=927664 RepID=A0A1I1DT10_9BACT|nr:hypothetical protein [Flexibacter flexilis]SFB77536.1 hypothetical protein SAMN05421780_101422 [Flexibacter flexilis DSM 6793]
MDILFKNAFIEVSRPQKNLVQVRYLEKSPTDADMDEYLVFMDKFYASGETFYMFSDMRLAPAYFSSSVRIKAGSWLKNNRELVRQRNKGAIFLFPNLVNQLMAKAVFAVQPYPVEYNIVRTEQEVNKWLAARGIKS